jgi:ABC-type branched-subunit amino acid transport system ATPase component
VNGREPVLSVRNLVSGYFDENVLHGVSLDVPNGAIVAVIGPNGSGKSTLLKTIYGLLPARHGEVVLQDRAGQQHNLVGLRPHAITRLGVNMVPQLANTFPEMSVRENLEVGAGGAGGRFADRLERVLQTFPALKPALSKRAATLSGGQRQMLGIARALIADPQLLILDEPSAGLAPAVVDEVFAKVNAINAEGVSILMVEQKARQCLALSDYGYVLDMGQNRIEGPGPRLLADPQVIDAYLGNRGRLDLSTLKSSKPFPTQGVIPTEEGSRH